MQPNNISIRRAPPVDSRRAAKKIKIFCTKLQKIKNNLNSATEIKIFAEKIKIFSENKYSEIKFRNKNKNNNIFMKLEINF